MSIELSYCSLGKFVQVMHESDIYDINYESRQRKQLGAGTNFSKEKVPSIG